MGLDNGITMRLPRWQEPTKEERRLAIEDSKVYVDYNKVDNTWEIDVLYWRKCWNIRRIILHLLGAYYKEEQYEYNLDLEDIEKLIYAFSHFTKREWEEDNDCLYHSWRDFKRMLKFDVHQLKKLYKYMKNHTEVTVYFYDSY